MKKIINLSLIIFFLVFLINTNSKAATFNVANITELNNAIATINGGPSSDIINITADIGTAATSITALTQPVTINAGGNTIYRQALSTLFVFSGANAVDFSTSILINDGATTTGGGAIFANTGVDITASTISFSSNTALAGGGGAVHLSGAGTSFTASDDATFVGNDSSDFAGAIHGSSVDINFTGASSTILFDQNTAGDFGGAMNLTSSTFDTAGTTTFSTNTATNYAGAIFMNAGSVFTATGSLSFLNNTATNANAGAVYMENANTTFNTAGTTIFSENTAATNGGAVVMESGSDFIATGNLSFLNNTATTDNGGAVYLTGSGTAFTTAANMTFDGNTAAVEGGALYITGGADFTATNTLVFSSNTATINNGGAIYIDGSGFTASSDVTFTGNLSDNRGGAIYMTGGSDIDFTGANATILFDQNLATGLGGAIYIDGSGTTFNTAGATTFDNNTATVSGGALAIISASDFVATNTLVFSSNTATSGDGGAIILQNSGSSFTTYSDVTFVGNAADSGNGGAVYMHAASAIDFNNNDSIVLFQANSTSGGGGAAYITESTVFTTNADTTFYNNTAGSGGALFIIADADFVSTYGTTFQDNTATGGNGGAVYLINAGTAFTVTDSIFTGNAADSGLGGAIYIGMASITNLTAGSGDITFTGNTDSSGANDIHLAGGSLNLAGANDITFNGGLTDSGLVSIITKTGAGTVYLGGTTDLGSTVFNVNGGTANLMTTGTLSVDTLNTGASGTFDMNNSEIDAVAIDQLSNSGNLNIDVNATADTTDKITVAGTATIIGGTLGVNVIGLVTGTETFGIMEASTLTGTLDGVNLLSGRALLTLDYSTANWIYLIANVLTTNYSGIAGLSHNQSQVATALDTGSAIPTVDLNTVLNTIDALSDANKKLAFNDLAGSIYANAMTVATLNTARDHTYAKIDERNLTFNEDCYECNKGVKSIWGHMYGASNKFDADENTPGNFKADSFGLVAGWDIYAPNKNEFVGIMIGHGEHKTKQVADKVDIEEFTLGLYGGSFGEKWDFKGFAGVGHQKYEGTRNIAFLSRTAKSNFDGYSFALDLEAGYKKSLKEAIELRPFVGIGFNYTAIESFNETGADSVNLHTKKSDYVRTELRFGANLNNGKMERFDWYTEAMIKALPSGHRGEYKASFEDVRTNTMTIRGSDQGKALLALGLGGEYDVGKNWSLYTNLRMQNSGSVQGYYGNLGVTYKFCGGGNKCKQKADEPKK